MMPRPIHMVVAHWANQSLLPTIFSWHTHAQKTVALSSTEAEYMAMSDCSQQAMWIKILLSELGLTLGVIPIYGDNQGSIFIGSNPVHER